MATIKDIANKLGIAVSTVSKGLNGASDISDEMRQLVLDTAVEMGYASKKMKASGSRKVCIFIENMDYENIEQFGYEIIVGFKLAAARRHWDVNVVPTNLNMQTAEKFDSYMLKNGYSGAFLLGFTLHDDWVQQLNKTSVPTVLLDNYIERNNHIGYVGTDNYEGIDLAVSHLYSLGHKKIAFLNGSKNSMVSEQRQQSFITSMEKHGLEVNEDLIEYGYYVPDCAKDYVPGFVKHGATAIMCASDLIATGVITELHKLGLKVPEDVSVIGFDDLPIASQLTPSLTTIRQDRTDLGKSAFLLLDGLVHNVTISKLLLRAKFIQRESTGPCKN
ncbi:LacI family DNA-binding transcriptional regulator [Lachnospiraceae bacterium MD1]|jgi:LacI family transcriptional regulator|uniref:LacI family DNA-binding transcriptional regulator n=1 Tax=Variimorphobacter saccharofermentans TaxID=2755051 RepID=A0A839JZC5_9FIRM|nr:LacI family DNA-binding transcriptional regulator [Variimorphobacter saccharofermentans]MBB2182558.1 LacI family DNA-binding transcriptional regulator [Variimorphobacter saccharofermentans]